MTVTFQGSAILPAFPVCSHCLYVCYYGVDGSYRTVKVGLCKCEKCGGKHTA